MKLEEVLRPHRDQPQVLHLEIAARQFPQRLTGAPGPLAEGEVGPDDHHGRVQRAHHRVHEAFGRPTGDLAIELDHPHLIGTVVPQEPKAIVQGGEQSWRTISGEDRHRMWPQCHRNHLEVPSTLGEGVGPLPGNLQEPLMPLMHPVEVADDDDAMWHRVPFPWGEVRAGHDDRPRKV